MIRPFAYLAIGVLAAGASFAQAPVVFPTKPVRVIIPFPAGTSPDIIVRLMANPLSTVWGQPLVVDNRTGGSGAIGARAVASAPPDGHTILYTINSVIVGNPHLFAKLTYDPLKELVPVSQAVTLGYALVAKPDFPAKTLQQLVALAKQQPGRLNYASAGIGTGPHIVMEMFNRGVGIDIVHVPMTQPALNAIMSGQTELTMSPITSAAPLIASGKLLGLGVSTAKRIASVPNVPPIGDVLPGYAADAWHGFLAPAGTPPAIVERLAADLIRTLRLPEVEKRLVDLGLEVVASTPQAFAAVIKSDYDRWGEVIRAANIRLD